MIEVIFTLDYEIYGNGEGSLRSLVYEPAQRLMEVFNRLGKRFVAFIEVAELEKIQEQGSDAAVHEVRKQIQECYRQNFEIGLHIHPQWCNATREDGGWRLDYSEYNLCMLSRERIAQIVDSSISCLRDILGVPDFTPLAFRAGNWLFQPAQDLAGMLSERGIKVDSSVFKGGLLHHQGLDYRPALRNGYYWKFSADINMPTPRGILLELPIYSQMVPFWRMATGKRVGLQRKGSGAAKAGKDMLVRLMDFIRFLYPLKLDFCRMNLEELTRMLDAVIEKDRRDPDSFKPLVAIGHTKDLGDFDTIESFLGYLAEKRISVSTFREIFPRLK